MPDFKVPIDISLEKNEAPEAADALDEVAKHSERASEKAKEHGHSQREVREELRMLSEQAGPVGEILRYAFSGPLVALAAFGEAVELVKKSFENFSSIVDEFNAATRAISDAKIKAVADAMHAAAMAAVEAADTQAKLTDAYKSGDAAIENRIKLYAAEVDALIKVEDAREKAFEAEIDRQVREGKLTQAQGDAAKENARLQLDQFKGSTDQAKLQNEITERQKQLQTARKNVNSGTDQAAIDAARDAELPSAADAADYGRQAEEAAKAKGLFRNIYGYNKAYSMEDLKNELISTEENKKDAEATDDWDALHEAYLQSIKDEIKSREKNIRNLEELQTTAQQENAQRKTATEIAQKRMDHDQDIVRSGPDRINALKQQSSSQAKTDAQVQRYNADAADARTAPPDDGIYSVALGERGAAAQIDARTTANNARLLEQQLRFQKNVSPDDLQAIHEAIERMMGFMENTSVSAPSKFDLKDILTRLQRLEQRSRTDLNR